MTLLDEPADEAAVGIQPVPASLRRLRALDIGVLWGDLAVGVLVLAAGALMVAPAKSSGLGMDLRTALVAIVIGSAAGSLLLALVGVAGHDRGVPTMTLLRPVLGRGGSYGASVINVVQLVGWTSFEFWAMALLASRVSQTVFGFRGFDLWLGVIAVGCIASALLGPIRYVQLWLERAGIWIVLASCGFLTIYLLTRHGLGHLLSAPRQGAPLAVGVDLVVAQPVSWLPLVADYNRFATGRRQNFVGTFGGYTLGNMWFYALGALLVLSAKLNDASPAGIAVSILGLSAGTVVGVVAADVVAGGRDPRGVRRHLLGRRQLAEPLSPSLASGHGGRGRGRGRRDRRLRHPRQLRGVLVPARVGVRAAVRRPARRLGGRRVAPGRRRKCPRRCGPGMVLAWIAGFGVYHWIVAPGTMPAWWTRRVTDLLPDAGRHAGWGASLPCFAVTFAIALVVSSVTRRRQKSAAGDLSQPAF